MLGEALPSLLIYGLVFAGGVWFLLQVADAQDVRKKEAADDAGEGGVNRLPENIRGGNQTRSISHLKQGGH